MKKMNKALALLLALTLLLSLSVTSAFAASAQKDGLKVTLTSDKKEYKKDEVIQIDANLDNTDDAYISDISMRIEAPDGFKVDNVASLKSDLGISMSADIKKISKTAAPGATGENDSNAPQKNDSPADTGESNSAIWAALAAIVLAAIVGAVMFKFKNGKKIVSIALSLALALSAFSLFASPALANGDDKNKFIVEENVKVGGENITIKAVINYKKTAPRDNLVLTSSEEKVAVGEKENNAVYFYAEGDKHLKDVKLYCAKELLCSMQDNGLDGDKKANDGTYTAKVDINNSKVQALKFNAVAVNKFEKKIPSNEIKIEIYEKLSDTELKSMETLDNEIENLVDDESFKLLPLDEKKKEAENLIKKQTESGNIIKNSVMYDDKNELYTFEYACGILGGIMLKNLEQPGEKELYKAPVNLNKNARFDLLEDTEPIKNAPTHSNAIIYYAFDFYPFSPRASYYETIKRNWPKVGVNPTVDTRVTVNDLKKIDAYDIIVFSTHGTYINAKDYTGSVICLRDRGGFFKDLYYSADLRSQRIIKINRQYWICPSFFEYYYAEGQKLQDKMVFSESCTFMGEYGNVDTSYANTFIKCGVPTVIGFHNSVYAIYSVDLMNIYVTNLAQGKTAQTALTAGTDMLGINDYEWAKAQGIKNPRPDNFAYPIICGSPLAKLPAFTEPMN